MRVLVIADTPFLPPTAGNRQRIDAMLGYLAANGVELAALLLPAPDRAEWDVEGMRARLARLEIAAPPPPSTARRAARALRRLARARLGEAPFGVDDWCPRWFRARAAAVVRAWGPDVVLVEYVFLSACLDTAPARRRVRVIDTHDVMHERDAVYRAAGLAPQWFHTTVDEERRGLARADLVLAIQPDEGRRFRAMVPDVPVLVVPHGLAVLPAPPARARPARLLFVASYNDLNVRGLAWLLDAVWPALRARCPEAELHVCGSIAEKLGAAPAGVVVRGVVPALAPEYEAARVVVDPVAWGTGLPIKVVEALAHGRPVVSARAAAMEEAGGVLVRPEAAAFQAAVERLLVDDGWWAAQVAAAAATGRRFSAETAFAPLLARLEAMVAARR
jgi:glycosyltransferase involved in cell wall biosynthesis